MSSASSLMTTAASDTSSSADSRYYSGGARRPTNVETTREASSLVPAVVVQWSAPPVQSSPARRRSYNLKARGVVIAKESTGGNSQKVYCVCKLCKGQRMVSKSTCYRHLRMEAEIAEDEDDHVKWNYAARWGNPNAEEGQIRMQPASIPLGL